MQTYSCNDCPARFRNARKVVNHDDLWFAYVFHKQTIRELAESSGHDRKTLVAYIDAVVVPKKIHHPRPIHLVVDATYFGKRMDDTAWGVVERPRQLAGREHAGPSHGGCDHELSSRDGHVPSRYQPPRMQAG